METLDYFKKFYPTPESVCELMYDKIDFSRLPDKTLLVCEPSAGKGNLIDYYAKRRWREDQKIDNIYYFENNPFFINELATFRATNLGRDWFNCSKNYWFDLIIANPPFDNGADHLWQAIRQVNFGQIVFLLNSKTLTQPRDEQSVRLVKYLTDVKADITHLQDSFIDAERPTNVGVALVSIMVDNKLD